MSQTAVLITFGRIIYVMVYVSNSIIVRIQRVDGWKYSEYMWGTLMHC